MPGGLQAVFFDVDDTLFPTHHFAWEARNKAVDAMIKAGLQADPEDILGRLGRIVDKYTSNYRAHFDVLLDEFPADSYTPVNPAVIVASGIVAYHSYKGRNLFPYEDAKQLLSRLKDMGIPAGVITSGVPVKQAEKLVRIGLVDFFRPEWIFISQQLGLSKEDADLYRTVCMLADVEPERTMYVGDHPVSDVDMAAEAGMITVLCRRSGHYSDLKGNREPDYEVANFLEIVEHIERDFPTK